jgi:hypothetical protein
MLRDPKSKFKYRPSFATDIRKTFARVKKALKARQPPAPQPPEPAQPDLTHVVPMRKRRAS